MPKVSIRVSEDLKREMEEHREVNWSEVARRAFTEHVRRIELADALASGSELTGEEVEEISRRVKKGIAERHGLTE